MSQIRFDHISIAIPRMESAPAVLVGELGGVPDRGGLSTVYRWASWRFKGGGRIEILEPVGEHGFLHRFLARRGPGVHHVTFKVPSLREACSRAEAHGYTIVGYDDSDPGWAEAFLHPKQALGTVVQLAESRSDRSAGKQHRQPPPDPPSSVTILGLRMRARSRERVETQWGLVLKGECTEGPAELVYRWPGSPMRLAVEIDPLRDDGPVCIEFASDRSMPRREGADRGLGAVFRPVSQGSSHQRRQREPS